MISNITRYCQILVDNVPYCQILIDIVQYHRLFYKFVEQCQIWSMAIRYGWIVIYIFSNPVKYSDPVLHCYILIDIVTYCCQTLSDIERCWKISLNILRYIRILLDIVMYFQMDVRYCQFLLGMASEYGQMLLEIVRLCLLL